MCHANVFEMNNLSPFLVTRATPRSPSLKEADGPPCRGVSVSGVQACCPPGQGKAAAVHWSVLRGQSISVVRSSTGKDSAGASSLRIVIIVRLAVFSGSVPKASCRVKGDLPQSPIRGGTREMRSYECNTGVSPVENVPWSVWSGFFRGQDARAPLFRGCLQYGVAMQRFVRGKTEIRVKLEHSTPQRGTMYQLFTLALQLPT